MSNNVCFNWDRSTYSLLRKWLISFCWNVKGPNSPNKQDEVKLLCNNEKSNFIGLLEIKIKVNRVVDITNRLFRGWHILKNLVIF